MMRILIADDHAVVRRGLKQILEEELAPIKFGEAETAEETLELIWKQSWDVVVLDISLPGRSGLEVLREVKQSHPNLPVLVLSMHPEDQYAVRVLKAGAAGYMTKETAPDELIRAIKKVSTGNKYISPTLAEKLVSTIATDNDDKPLHEELSDREFEVMCMLASGKLVSDIAVKLSLSRQTITSYRRRILAKMKMQADIELVSYAVKNGLIN